MYRIGIGLDLGYAHAKLGAVHLGHHDVGEQQVEGAVALDQGERFDGAARVGDGVTSSIVAEIELDEWQIAPGTRRSAIGQSARGRDLGAAISASGSPMQRLARPMI
jgi:hypothetical protein